LKSSTQGWNWFQHKRLPPFPQHASQTIGRKYVKEKEYWNWCEVLNLALLCLWTTSTKASSHLGSRSTIFPAPIWMDET
jgi:hypothetical protein